MIVHVPCILEHDILQQINKPERNMETYPLHERIKIGKKQLGNRITYDRLFSTDEMQGIQKDRVVIATVIPRS
jgi:hypothetical protein